MLYICDPSVRVGCISFPSAEQTIALFTIYISALFSLLLLHVLYPVCSVWPDQSFKQGRKPMLISAVFRNTRCLWVVVMEDDGPGQGKFLIRKAKFCVWLWI